MKPCGGCGAAIVWGVHYRTGNRMAFDAERRPEGRWLLDGRGKARMATREEREAEGFQGYVPHFATCPRASAFRRVYKGRKAQEKAQSAGEES